MLLLDYTAEEAQWPITPRTQISYLHFLPNNSIPFVHTRFSVLYWWALATVIVGYLETLPMIDRL